MDLFDFNGDGKASFEEQMIGTMLVMGAFDEKPDENEYDESEDISYDEDDNF